MNITISTHIQNDTNYIAVHGDIEMFDIPDFRKELYNISQNGPCTKIELNLHDVDYMDSMGLATVVNFIKMWRREGKSIKVVHPQERVDALFKLAGLSEFIYSEFPPVPQKHA